MCKGANVKNAIGPARDLLDDRELPGHAFDRRHGVDDARSLLGHRRYLRGAVIGLLSLDFAAPGARDTRAVAARRTHTSTGHVIARGQLSRDRPSHSSASADSLLVASDR